ncbi:MAG: phosphate ABC transporter permease PstA [Deltaproteobacteria bacterium]|nr:phosphate ABC transporter permease PstA [Deltaproteobacteria bacterium]
MTTVLERAYAGRKRAAMVATVASVIAVAFAAVPLLAVTFYVLKRGLGALSIAFFTELPRSVGEPGGGMVNAIAGTLELVCLASLMGIPVGIAAGLFIAEYRATRLARAARFCADVLAGVPSILVGVVVYAIVVVRMHRFSTFAGALSLATLMLPLVARMTDELARTVPDSLREAALALGAPRWRIAIHVVLRTAAPGIRAGCMLAVARVAGESAPLLFTAFNNRFWNESLFEPTSSLEVQIFTYTMSPYADWHGQAWAAALTLVALVIALNLGARRVLRAKRGTFA